MSDAEHKNDLAKDRTDWAEDRTLQANERTFAGWMRTGMASIGVALGLKAVFGDFDPTWAAKAVASVFLVAGVIMIWSAYRNACTTHKRLDQHAANAQPPRIFAIIAAAMAAGGIATGFILWSL